MAFFADIIIAFGNALVSFFLNTVVTKLIVFSCSIIFLFFVFPEIVTFLVPNSILTAITDIYSQVPSDMLYWMHLFRIGYMMQVLIPCLAIRFMIKRL